MLFWKQSTDFRGIAAKCQIDKCLHSCICILAHVSCLILKSPTQAGARVRVMLALAKPPNTLSFEY